MNGFFFKDRASKGELRLKDAREIVTLYPNCADLCAFDVDEECMDHDTSCSEYECGCESEVY